MPPKASATASTGGSKAAKTPYDEYFEAFDKVQKRNPKIIGPMMIRGITKTRGEDSDSEGLDDDDEEEEEDTSKYTAEEMAALRYVFITKEREFHLDTMRDFVLGEKANSAILMFTTSFSYEIRDGFYEYRNMSWKQLKTPAEKFDSLFAYTYLLKMYDTWMHDNEGDMEEVGEGLAALWKGLLKNSDEKLGIDPEYSRPGVIALLDDFKSDLERADLEFNYE